jgi:very-short-patch-repair endonuclease
MPKSIDRARKLRRENTEAEALLWRALRNGHAGAKFRRQVPIGPYVADFLCHELKVIVEVDGGQHCENAADTARTEYLNRLGYEVLRFWNNNVVDNLEGVVSILTLAMHDAAKRRASQRRGD